MQNKYKFKELNPILPGNFRVHFVPQRLTKKAKNIHPSGEPHSPICGVIRGLRYQSTAAPQNALQMNECD